MRVSASQSERYPLPPFAGREAPGIMNYAPEVAKRLSGAACDPCDPRALGVLVVGEVAALDGSVHGEVFAAVFPIRALLAGTRQLDADRTVDGRCDRCAGDSKAHPDVAQ